MATHYLESTKIGPLEHVPDAQLLHLLFFERVSVLDKRDLSIEVIVGEVTFRRRSSDSSLGGLDLAVTDKIPCALGAKAGTDQKRYRPHPLQHEGDPP